MSKQIKQIKWDSSTTIPQDRAIFRVSDGIISQLSIYAQPGTSFDIGVVGVVSSSTITIGGIGYIQLNDIPINSLILNEESKNGDWQQPMIVECVYEGGSNNGN